MDFYNQWNRPPKQPEINNEPDMVEPGRVPSIKQQVQDFMLAGARLDLTRRMRYDFPHGEPIDESYYDPTRYKGFDFKDAMAHMIMMENRAREIKKERSKDAKNEPEKSTAEPGAGSVDSGGDSGTPGEVDTKKD